MSNIDIEKVETPMPKTPNNNILPNNLAKTIQEILEEKNAFSKILHDLSHEMFEVLRTDSTNANKIEELRQKMTDEIDNFFGDLELQLKPIANPNQDQDIPNL